MKGPTGEECHTHARTQTLDDTLEWQNTHSDKHYLRVLLCSLLARESAARNMTMEDVISDEAFIADNQRSSVRHG